MAYKTLFYQLDRVVNIYDYLLNIFTITAAHNRKKKTVSVLDELLIQ
jgi:hypothetical protein